MNAPISILALATSLIISTPSAPPEISTLQPAIYKPVAAVSSTPAKGFSKLDLMPYSLAPVGTFANTYAPGNCTWMVASMKKIPESWGNANTWSARAAAEGRTVSSLPVRGAIAQTSRGSLGHVGVVLEVSGDQFLMQEMNEYGYGIVDTRWQPAADYSFIYI